ncbi:MAG: twin arginine-targeting protein translocase TatB [Rhodospirillales bacterium 20-64-7]|nr:MAG: twin arginine-targeting protein translocase TatB [Rhodospirillales bacterium 20-64-7]
MFGFSWAEIGLIMAVALIAIGPKDLPIAIKTVTGLMKKARGMAAEFQGHLDEMMREANLSEVKTEISKLRRFDFKSAAEQAIDPDGSLRGAVREPFDLARDPDVPVMTPADPAYVPPAPVLEELPDAPAFIPPEAARKDKVPDFIPPGTKRWGY